MEKIQRVGVWPVGLVGGLMVEKPICDNVTGKVIGFNAAWKPDRPFPLDMAGFAINLRLLLENKNAAFSYEVQGGYQESEILSQIVTRNELEPLADFCTKVDSLILHSIPFCIVKYNGHSLRLYAGVRVAHSDRATAIKRGTTVDQER